MEGYTKIASYTKHGDRWYHKADTSRQGPSVNNTDFHQGQRPAPLRTTQAPRPTPPPVRPGGPLPPAPPPLPDAARHRRLETYAPPDTLGLVTMVQRGEPLPPLTPQRPMVNHLAHTVCGKMPCTCGVPRQPTGEEMLAVQRAQGKR
jgi:hypothetical protein